MFSERSRVLSLAAVFTVAITLIGGWWLLSGQEQSDPQKVATGLAPAGMEAPSGVAPTPAASVKPVAVDLRRVAPGQFDPHNKYSRWLRGEVDFSKRDRIVSADKIKSLKGASHALLPSLGVQNAAEGTSALSSGAAFEGLDYTQCCGGGGNVPPDPELAAGPNNLIAAVNVAFAIYDKSGSKLVGPITFESFMGSNPACTNVFDPNAIYDEKEDRFILGVATRGGYYCAAVSQTSNPVGSWWIYAFPMVSGRDFFDYPHAGVGRDAIYVGANIFGVSRFKEGRIYALEKDEMYLGHSARNVALGLGSNYDTPQPLNLHGSNQGTWPNSGPHYFLSDSNYNGRTYAIHSWTDPFGANQVSLQGTVDLNAATDVTAGFPLDVPQQGGGTLDGGDWRPQDFEYRNGFGWTVMAIACDPGSGTVNCVRWAKIDLANATVADAGVYAGNGTYRTYADLAVNACGDMAVGYTKSSSSMYPGIYYSGRESSDTAGLLQDETLLKAGEIAYTSFEPNAPRRWGDYTGMTIDPDGKTFWYLGEYSKDTGTTNGRWGTRIGAFSFATCDPGGTPPANRAPQANAGPDQTVNGGDLVTLDGSFSSDPDGDTLTYNWVENPSTGITLSAATAVKPTFTAPTGPATLNFDLTVSDGALSATDSVTITVRDPNSGTSPQVTSCTPSSGSLNQRLAVGVAGANFASGATVDFGNDIAVQAVTFLSGSQLDVRIKVQRRAAGGPRTVIVTNPDGTSGQLEGCFSVN